MLNVSGHRLDTMEIESALVSHTALVAEAAVVGRPDDVTGEAVCAFVVIKGARPSGDAAKAMANGRAGRCRLPAAGLLLQCQYPGREFLRFGFIDLRIGGHRDRTINP